MEIFSRELMNTELEIKICSVAKNYARSAAIDCFEDVAMLEDLLSMYKFGSDISMINSEPVGSVVKITGSTLDCLMSAFKACQMSKGAIDICLGEYFLKAKKDEQIPIHSEPRRAKLAIDAENYLVQKLEDGRLDLGAVGKGYAIDCAVEKLIDVWDIKSAFLSFGASSIYAFGKPDNAEAWTVTLDNDGKVVIPLKDTAVGASGTAVQGSHILDARTGEIPENQPFRTWAFCKNAAIADAMSTAFMLLTPQEIKEICDSHNISAAIQQSPNSPIEFFTVS